MPCGSLEYGTTVKALRLPLWRCSMQATGARKRFLCGAALAVIFAAVGSGCADRCCGVRSVAEQATPQNQQDWHARYARIEIGMSRSQVEEILGAPTDDLKRFDNRLGYGPPPTIEPWQSPYTPCCIWIYYSEHGTVEDKKFFSNAR